MATEKVQYPQSERTRKLPQTTFVPSSLLTVNMFRDSVYKSITIRLSGSIVTTFASGTPVADAQSTLDNLVPYISVVVDGSRTVKNVKPHLMHMQQLLLSQVQAERRSSAAAAAALDNLALTDGSFVYGTTGQITTVSESIMIPFEMVYCNPGTGREQTWLNLKGAASAEIKFTTGAYSALLGFGNTAPVVYTSGTFVLDVITREAAEVPSNVLFSDFKQTTKSITLSAQTTQYAIDINRGNLLAGIMFFCQDGAAGAGGAASGKLASNLALTNILLQLNGQSNVKTTDFKSLQAEMRQQFGIQAPFASSVSRIDGMAYLGLLRSHDISTALPVRPPRVDNVQLYVDSNTSANVTYTSPITITLMTDEIVVPT